jgi:hypothetical protein
MEDCKRIIGINVFIFTSSKSFIIYEFALVLDIAPTYN